MTDTRDPAKDLPEPGPNPPPVFDEPAVPAPAVDDPPLRNEEF